MKKYRARLATTLVLALSASGVITLASTHVGADVGPDIVITELMINPRDVYDSRGEWIELTNRGVVPTNLEGWTFTDGRRENVVLPDLPIAPGERIVLARNADPYANGGARPDWVYGNQIVLYNLGDRLILSDPDGDEHDRVDWYPESGLQVPSGRSLALGDLSFDTSDAASWCASTTVMTRGDLGSPGEPNSCDAPRAPLVISEILQNPRRSSDFVGEFFEVFNPGESEVDMTGWTIKDDDRDRFTVDTPTVVAPGGYTVFGITPIGNGNAPLDYVYGSAMRLHNDRDELAIADEHGVLVDRVAWDNGRTFPDPNGASMSLLDPTADNAVGSNWCSATKAWAYGDRGTPGTPTWCLAPGANPIVVTEIMFDPETPTSERSAEWFELANLGETTVDLTGWTVTAGDWKTHSIEALSIEPGGFAVLAASGDPVLNGELSPDYVYGTNLPLYNASSRIILKNADGMIVDRVDWSAGRGFPIPSGRSITLGLPSADNALGPNWCASTTRWATGDFGAPGALGSCEAPPAPPAVMITEIMRNPAIVSDSNGEWIEIHNSTGTDIDLRGWSIGDRSSDHHGIRSTVVLPAGGNVVLARRSDTSRNGGVVAAYAYGDGLVLSNVDDEIQLLDQYGQFVDEVSWNADSLLRPNGASIALTVDGWCISGPQFGAGDLGTPGTPNDCTPLPHANVIISEVHHDPGVVSDTVGEWFELTNAGDTPVDIEGWRFRDDDADHHVISTGVPWMLEPGAAVVLGRDTSQALNGEAPVDYAYGADFPMVDGADEITLLDADLVWVDRVTWTPAQPLPVAPGASASLRHLSADNGVSSNWCRSVTTFGTLGELGTPGRPNLCEVPPPTTTSTSTTTTSTTVPVGEAFVRVTAMCAAFDGEHEGSYQFRVRHEAGAGPLEYRLQIAANVLHEGTIDIGEAQYVWLPIPSQGVKVIPAGDWINGYRGTASTNTATCASSTTTSTSTTTTTTTTTVPDPDPIVRPLTNGFGILATGDPECGKGLKISGSKISVEGGARSNGDVKVSGSGVSFDGIISYGGTASVGKKTQSGGVVYDATPVAPAVVWQAARYAPGSAWSNDANYVAHQGDWTVDAATPGLHYVAGDVTVDGSIADLSGVTIVATGTITVSGTTQFAPWDPSLPTLLADGGDCQTTGIKLSGSAVEWSGLFAAPNGEIHISGSKIRGGSVLARTIQLSGSDIELK